MIRIVMYGSPVASRIDWLSDELGHGYSVVGLEYAADEDQKQAALNDANAVVTVSWHADLPTPSDLRLVQVPGVGCDEIDLATLPETATLCNVHGHGAGVAEYAILQLLESRHRLTSAEADFRTGSWQRSSRFGAPPHRELRDTTVGIVGYGDIGRAIAVRLAPFGVRLLAANRTRRTDTLIGGWYGLDRLPEMLVQCDSAVLAIPLVEDTRSLIGQPELDALGPDGFLVNVARGPVVDEAALWHALHDGRIAGAALDVWYQYPDEDTPRLAPSQFPFKDLPNVRMTPHIAGWTEGTMSERWSEIAENCRRVSTGQPFVNIVQHPTAV